MEALIFKVANTIALLGWIILILFQKKTWMDKVVIGIIVTAFTILYTSIVFISLDGNEAASFSSLEGVMAIFTTERAVLTGWAHFLAFDLMVGLYIVKNAQKNEIDSMVIIPSLLLTFILGPVGLLLFLIIRTIHTKRYFHSFS